MINSIKRLALISALSIFNYSYYYCYKYSPLSCMTCINAQHDTTQLDKFRVRARLTVPKCQMEPIICDRDQDVCVTITMHIGVDHYWIGSGCDKHENFQHIACENVHTLTRNVQIGIVQERRALQRVCVCTTNLCNHIAINQSSILLIFICALIFFVYYNSAS